MFEILQFIAKNGFVNFKNFVKKYKKTAIFVCLWFYLYVNISI